MDLSTRLWRITTEFVGFIPQSLMLRSSDEFYYIEIGLLLTLDFPRRGFPTMQVTVTVPLSGSLLSHSIG